MPKLTDDQQRFLDRMLLAHAVKKGKLGGRKLSKVKDQYADFLRRGKKCDEALRDLRRGFGPEVAAPYDKLLQELRTRVDHAADAGDETIFAAAYQELEAIKVGIRNAIDALKTERKETTEASAKFETAIGKVKGQQDPVKRKEQARKVGASCEQWLRNHPGVVAPKVTAVYLDTLEMSGTAERSNLNLLAANLANQSYALCREVDKVIDDDLFFVQDTNHDYTGQMTRLEAQIRKTLKLAQDGNYTMAASQLGRTLDELLSTQWRVMPPTLEELDLERGEDGSSEDDETGLVPVASDAPPKKLSDSEEAASALVKIGEIAGHLEDEIKELALALADVGGRATQCRQDNADRTALLGADLDLIGFLVDDATQALADARNQLAKTKLAVTEGDKCKDDARKWEPHLKDAAQASDSGLACVSNGARLLGEVEGGIILMKRAVESIDSFETRVAEVDDKLLIRVTANLAAAIGCKGRWAQGDHLMLLQHLVFTSADDAEATRLAATAVDARTFDAAVRKLIAAPKLGTSAVTTMLAQCQRLLMDAERFFGTPGTAEQTLSSADLRDKFTRIVKLAANEAAKFTVPVLPRPEGSSSKDPLQSVGVAVVGGGPIGLLAAVEARMAGASEVHVYEGRSDPYSRMNVIKIDDAASRRLIAAGVGEEVFPKGFSKSQVASVKTIENALLGRCNALGVKMERDRFLVNVTRDGGGGRTQLTFKGDDVPKSCDLLILATGGSIASAQKYADNVVLADVLGIPVQKSQAKDYAAVGLFAKDADEPGVDQQKKPVDGWNYDFATAEVKYLVTQLTEEEYRAYTAEPRLLIERLQKDARGAKLVNEQQLKPQTVDPAFKARTLEKKDLDGAIKTAWDKIIDDMQGLDNFFGNDKKADQKAVAKAQANARISLTRTVDERAKKGEESKLSPEDVEKALMSALLNELGASRFPIEVQQARGVVGAKGGVVLVGDSAATPHPSTAKGLNTGIAEMGAVRDLVQDLQKGSGTEEDRQKATQVYAFEVKRRTDFMVDEALETMQSGARNRIKNFWARSCLPEIKKLVKSDKHEPFSTDLGKKITALSVPRDDANKDRDWKLREAAVKNLRKLETDLRAAQKAVDLLIRGGTTDADALMAPYLALLV